MWLKCIECKILSSDYNLKYKLCLYCIYKKKITE